jgi:predicted DNA-binding transcriptional regulator AlpA
MEEPILGPMDWTSNETGGLSPRHILRMAGEGKFPQPVRVTEGTERQKGRIAFVRSEVRAWVAERIAERDGVTSSSSAPAVVQEPEAIQANSRHNGDKHVAAGDLPTRSTR